MLPSGRLLLQRLEERPQEALTNSGQHQQMLDDERLAMILQNAEFVEALRSDQDFMESLDTRTSNSKISWMRPNRCETHGRRGCLQGKTQANGQK